MAYLFVCGREDGVEGAEADEERDDDLLEEGEKDDGLDAEELGEGAHGAQAHPVGAVEKHQAVHGSELRHVVHQQQVGEGDRETEFPLPVHPRLFAAERDQGRRRSHHHVLQDAVFARVLQVRTVLLRRQEAQREHVLHLKIFGFKND